MYKKLRQVVAFCRLWLKKIKLRHVGVAALILVPLCFIGFAVSFFWPRAVAFSYSGTNCFFNPVILPSLVAKENSPTFGVEFGNIVKLGKMPLYSSKTCVTLLNPPKSAETVKLSPFGNKLFKKNISVSPQVLPKVQALAKLDAPVPAKDPLTFKLDQADQMFEYQLMVNDLKTSCAKKDVGLSCDLAPLNLAQSTKYTFALHRMFGGKSAEIVLSKNITTVEAIGIINSSIPNGERVYGIPTEMVLTLNKPAKSHAGVHVQLVNSDNTRQEMPITSTLAGDKIIIKFTQPLPRSVVFEVSVEKIDAEDRAFLPTPYAMRFSTSGGPKVLGISIGGSRVQPGGSFTLNFDSAILPTQNLQNFIHVEANGARVAATVSLRGRSLVVTPAALDRCTPFTVKVIDGLQNDAGVAGGSAWQYKSRVICQTVFSIGSSLQGRGIIGYRFGTGPSKVIYVGTTHGDEKSSTFTLNSWVDALESNPDRIPAHRTIIVIPNLNPDGYAANTRVNARNVDLNRNFPANNWKSDVTMPGGAMNVGGGGSAPLSEPESSALANYVLGQGPRLVLTYHAVGPLVAANESGDSMTLGNSYASRVGYPSYGSGAGGAFHYDTTGAFEDWLHDKPGIPALLIEHASKTSNEFNRHRDAMWAMAQLP